MQTIKPVHLAALVTAAAMGGCGHYHEERIYVPAGPAVTYEPAPAPQMVQTPPPEPPAEETAVVERPPDQVVTSTFDADLSPYGDWVVIGTYGRCWHPTHVAAEWRPYTVGHWVWTDDGWMWVSEEPFGYSTCHYGRWFLDPGYGWCWMPGAIWAPAWVAWRSGGGYVGWAPLGPSISIGARLEIGDTETRDIPADHFCFVEERRLTEPRIHERIVNVRNNTTIINRTTNITKITTVNNTVVNRSLTVERVERDTGQKVQRTAIKQATTAAEARQMAARGEPVAYRPAPLVQAQQAKIEQIKRLPAEPVRRAAEPRNPGQAAQPKAVPQPKASVEAERAKAQEAESERPSAAEARNAEAQRARLAEQQRLESERVRAADAKRADAERAKAEAQRLEAERSRSAEQKRVEAERASAAEAERAKAAEARRVEAERARIAEQKRVEAERARAAEAERVKAAEAERARAAAEERAKRDAEERAKREAEDAKRKPNDAGRADAQ